MLAAGWGQKAQEDPPPGCIQVQAILTRIFEGSEPCVSGLGNLVSVGGRQRRYAAVKGMQVKDL